MIRPLPLLLALMPLLPVPASADQPPYALLLKNRTCGPIHVALESRMACADLSTGCRFEIQPERYKEVGLRFRERIEWMTVSVAGDCKSDSPPSVIVGQCALPMGKLFPWNDIRLETGFATPFGGDTETFTPADNPGTDLGNPVEIDIMLAECDDDSSPSRCQVFCRDPNAGSDGDEGSGDFD